MGARIRLAEGAHQPFRVTYWRRPQSFRLEPRRWGDLDLPTLLRTVRVICLDTGLPVEFPKGFVDSLGMIDLDLDLARAG